MNISFTRLKIIPIITLPVLLFLLVACDSSVSRVDSGADIDLRRQWSDTDSRLVAQEMIQDVLSGDWLSAFNRSRGKVPVVIVGTLRNLSHGQINTDAFIVDLERALIRSGKVDYLTLAKDREEIRRVVKTQAVHVTQASRKAMGQGIGADFMLQGSINMIVDAIDSKQARSYQVDLVLIQLDNNRKVWIKQKKIKKTAKKSGINL